MIDGGETARPRVFTIQAGGAFTDVLAQGLLARAGADPLALARTTVLLPTRRAARALTEAFLRVTGGQALLLPRLLALADLDGDPDGVAAGDSFAGDLPVAIDPLRRRLILARLVMSRGGDFAVTPDQALRLAQALAELIDEALTERIDFARLNDLAPEAFAGHWQRTVEFLRIVTAFWPAILAERGMVDPATLRARALETRAARWRETPPAEPVVAAGFIGADPALSELIATVARLPRGAVVLPGLDQQLDAEGWDEIEPTHPQFGLKSLLEAIGVARRDVTPWLSEEGHAPRARLLTEAMRPASTTDQWRSGPPIAPGALDGLTRVDCETMGEEAEIIALAMRGALEVPGRTAALVTPDRALARRVGAALKRWDIAVDDSAGRPLGETPVGNWLRLVADCVVGRFAPRPLLAMLKHPLAAAGLPVEALRRDTRLMERFVLRGPRPGPGIEGLRAALSRVPDATFETPDDRRRIGDLLDALADRIGPFIAIVEAGGGALEDLLTRHAEAAEALAATPREPGETRLWRDQDGEAAADLIARLCAPSDHGLPDIPADRYPAMLAALMEDVAIRPLYGAHPRLSIWGLIEARLQRADLMILGGLNEGTWPPLPGEEPWMSRPMRAQFGLSPPEARIGAAAQDFVLAAAGPRVLLTRAKRVDGAPSVPARFLSRLDILLAGSGLALSRRSARQWLAWADGLDRPAKVKACDPPEPRPPFAARPRKLSVTAVERWMRDPYALYAGHILRLRVLDPIDADPGAAERGQFVHHALDRFIRRFPDRLPGDHESLEALLEDGRAAFGETLGHPSVAAFWWPRFERVARWFIAFERERRREGVRPAGTEIAGFVDIDADAGPFRLTAKADRIDRLPDGGLAIIDYKTGRPPSVDAVARGYAPQLPLEGVIAEQGGFGGIPAGVARELIFLRLGGGNPPGEIQAALGKGDVGHAVEETWRGLCALIDLFDAASTPYHSAPRPEFAFAGDYDHLARIGEWTAP
jgi:ATP-dependent helicase/nuclease subunit B